jgi:hypothetical protein
VVGEHLGEFLLGDVAVFVAVGTRQPHLNRFGDLVLRQLPVFVLVEPAKQLICIGWPSSGASPSPRRLRTGRFNPQRDQTGRQ